MVSADKDKTREQIRDEIITLGEKFWAEFDTLTANAEFESTKYPGLRGKQLEYDGKTANVSMGVIPGLTMEMHKDFRDNMVANKYYKLLSDEQT